MFWTLCAVGLLTAVAVAMIGWSLPFAPHGGWFEDWSWSTSDDDSGFGVFDFFSGDSGDCTDSGGDCSSE